MIRLTCLLRRKPGMSSEDFHAYWRDVHGPLIASTKSGSYVLRYEQHHSVDANEQGRNYDGVTIQWFASADAFYASLQEDDYALIDADTRKFLDVDRLEFILTNEPEVVFDRLG